jgi:diacylglycerol kinase family enzyme
MQALRLLVASTVVDVGIGMRLCPRANHDTARFQLVASALSPTQLAMQLPAVRAGRALDGAPHLDRLASVARVRFDEEEPYTLDGDLFRARELTVAIGPRINLVRT